MEDSAKKNTTEVNNKDTTTAANNKDTLQEPNQLSAAQEATVQAAVAGRVKDLSQRRSIRQTRSLKLVAMLEEIRARSLVEGALDRLRDLTHQHNPSSADISQQDISSGAPATSSPTTPSVSDAEPSTRTLRHALANLTVSVRVVRLPAQQSTEMSQRERDLLAQYRWAARQEQPAAAAFQRSSRRHTKAHRTTQRH